MHPERAIMHELATPKETGGDMATLGMAVLGTLEVLLLKAANEVESGNLERMRKFTGLVDHMNANDMISGPVARIVQSILVGMQLPDRNTQIVADAVFILKRYRTLLEESCGFAQRGAALSSHAVSNAVGEILAGIRLSDIRHKIMEAMGKAKLCALPEDSLPARHDTIADIELF